MNTFLWIWLILAGFHFLLLCIEAFDLVVNGPQPPADSIAIYIIVGVFMIGISILFPLIWIDYLSSLKDRKRCEQRSAHIPGCVVGEEKDGKDDC